LERGLPCRVPIVETGTVLHQQPDDIGMAIDRDEHQGRPAALRFRIEAGVSAK
jgi:hypothetical protein